MKNKSFVTLYLKSGLKIKGYYADDEYEYIYDSWENKTKHITFSNCEVLTADVSAILWSKK